MKRSWFTAELSLPPDRLRNALALLVAPDADGEVNLLGNAFVVRGNGRDAVCLAAAHSFAAVKRIQEARTAIGTFNVAPGFGSRLPPTIDPEEIRALFVADKQSVECRIRQLVYVDGYEVVLFTVEAGDGREVFNQGLAVDLGAPQVGDEIAVLTESPTLMRGVTGTATIETRVECRYGVVTEVIMGSEKLLGQQSFCFRTTVPVNGGMSGSAVLRKPKEGESLVACGVISSDHSTDESRTNVLIPGHSTASMLWPSMCFGMNVRIGAEPARYHLLHELLQKGVLDNQSDRISIAVNTYSDETQVHYLDERGATPVGAILKMPPQPQP